MMTATSHHVRLSTIFTSQNIFYQGAYRDIFNKMLTFKNILSTDASVAHVNIV